MSDQGPEKRTYSNRKEGQSSSSDEEPPSTKYMVSTATGRQTVSRIEDTTALESHLKVKSKVSSQPNEENQIQRQGEQIMVKKKKKKKHKHKHQESEKQQQQTQQKQNKPKKKKKNKLKQEEAAQIKVEPQKGEEKSVEKQKSAKKKHKKKSKQHKQLKQKAPQIKSEEQKEPQTKVVKADVEQKTKQKEKQIKAEKSGKPEKEKRKRKHKSKSTVKSDEESPEKDTKVKSRSKQKKESVPEKRGRKNTTPIKRKRASIHEQQAVINKRWRVKKKSGFWNAQSRRLWGQFRAGPYRKEVKVSKQEQRKIIEKLVGHGPYREVPPTEKAKNQIYNENEDDNQEVKIQGDIIPEAQSNTQRQAKQQQEQDEQTVVSKKEKKKKKKTEKESDEQVENSKEKHKSKRKSKKKEKQEQQKTQPDQKPKKRKKRSKKSQKGEQVKQEAAGNQVKQQQTTTDIKAEESAQKKKTKKKKKRQQSSDSSSSNEQEGKKTKRKNKPITKKPRPPKEKANLFTRQQSQRIIDLFAVDGGNYPEMMKELPGIPLKKVRSHLRMLFHRALDIITYKVQHQCQRKIKEWEEDQRTEIVRELHRIRSSNRLLAQNQVHFRQNMTYLMRSYSDQSYLQKVKPQAIETLYRRLESFVRGYNTINRSKRISAASISQSKNKQKEQRYKFSKQVTRKPIISGGHLLSRTSVKKQPKEEPDQEDLQQKIRAMASPQNVVDDWSRQEEKKLCELYIQNVFEADEAICDKLKEIYGISIKWRDFEVLQRKINQLIRMALIKLQNLTSRPYCQVDRQKAKERKQIKMFDNIKRQMENSNDINKTAEDFTEYYFNKRQRTSMFLYDNDIFKKEERVEYKHRIFKNLSLFERQVFGHLQSHRLKTKLVKILIEEFPPQKDIEDAVQEAKNFSKWARQSQKQGNVHSIKHILTGDRIVHDADDSDDDSIMADINKVPIIKPAGYEASYSQTQSMANDFSLSMVEKKSQTFAVSKVGDMTVPIDLDDEDYIDFEEPEKQQFNKNDNQNEEDSVGSADYSKLTKIYTSLNQSNLNFD